MNKLILIVVYLVLIQYLSGQVYEPIISSNQLVEFNVCHPVFDGTANESFQSTGDTIISNTNYIIIEDINFTGIYFSKGYLRQDSLNSKAWFKTDDSDEKLIMDLAMEVGDSIFIDNEMYGSRYSTAVKIDTVDSRRVIELDYIYPRMLATQTDTIKYRPLKFIEGIGTNGFLIYQLEDNGIRNYGYLLETVFKDGIKVYENLEDCKFPVSSDELNSEEFKIYPNPTKDKMTIEYSGNTKITKYEIIDLTGKIIKSVKANSSIQNIEIQDVQNGIYILRAQVGSEFILKKLLVN